MIIDPVNLIRILFSEILLCVKISVLLQTKLAVGKQGDEQLALAQCRTGILSGF
jgi:hypothetical protein